jgi:hypothetical protein
MLTDVQIRNAKPTDKPQRLSDSNGLYLLINPKGSNMKNLESCRIIILKAILIKALKN